ncbi:hypothetical protein BVG79_01627 [Ketogulonicigenium robustum]|uniref:Zinc finger CHCC-type domain-containing protein n=1 Tax=Ketogulonicigenium robustum TaxID=92947 RepID=A0A1W6P0P7_9RHOB|nr:zinc-finger domain-containing protein [Ketogulonicigenium robustum]ARO14971.1 hypothetical protein BVG79_01627 [Ketogulonicigenium robustum]
MSTPAVQLNRPAPVIRTVSASRVACDGLTNSPVLGHPRVWLSIPPGQDFVDCPYCDARFVQVGGEGQGH